MPTVMQYPDRDILAQDLAEVVAGQLAEAIDAKGRASLAVPGGTTPAAFLRALSAQQLDWSRVNVMLTDERFVDENSERSNTRLLRRTLLQGLAGSAQLVPMYLAADQPEQVLQKLGDGVKSFLPLDVVVLGMGLDMHIASIFPGAHNLDAALAKAAPPLLVMRAPNAPEPRLTLTAPVLRAAGCVHLLITGTAKKSALETAFVEGPARDAPVRVVLSLERTEIHYAD